MLCGVSFGSVEGGRCADATPPERSKASAAEPQPFQLSSHAASGSEAALLLCLRLPCPRLTSMPPDSVLVPLSSIDQAGVETSASVFAYVVAGSIDIEALRQAALRVIDKWRLLAGTIEWANQTYNVRVPLGEVPNSRLYFTLSFSAAPLGIVYPELSHASATVLERPPLSCFRHKNTPNSLAAHAKAAHPIISIHVSSYADYTCKRASLIALPETVPEMAPHAGIGISCSHGMLDGTGQGMFVHFLDAELHGMLAQAKQPRDSHILQDAPGPHPRSFPQA